MSLTRQARIASLGGLRRYVVLRSNILIKIMRKIVGSPVWSAARREAFSSHSDNLYTWIVC